MAAMSRLFETCVFVDVRARGAAKILCHELVRAELLAHQAGLPCQEPGGQQVLVAVPLQFPSGVQDAVARRDLGPVMQALAPVDQSPDPVQSFDAGKLLPQVPYETGLHIGTSRTVGSGLIVHLVADYGRVVAVMFGDLANDTLGIAQKIRVRDVHILADPVGGSLAIQPRHQDLRDAS